MLRLREVIGIPGEFDFSRYLTPLPHVVPTLRQSLLDGYEQAMLDAVARGEMGEYNAWKNLTDMSTQWPTEKIVEWASAVGVSPGDPFPPVYGPFNPPVKDSLRNDPAQGTPYHQGSRHTEMYGGDPDCEHWWAVPKWSGIECNDCSAWFCH